MGERERSTYSENELEHNSVDADIASARAIAKSFAQERAKKREGGAAPEEAPEKEAPVEAPEGAEGEAGVDADELAVFEDDAGLPGAPLPEFGALTVGVVNQDADLKNKARFEGEQKLAASLNEHKGLRKVLDMVWKGGIARSYYRQKYILEAKKEMLEAQTLVLEGNDKERNRYNRDISKSFLSEVEGVIDESAGDSRKSLRENYPELHKKISDIVAAYADGTIKDPEDASRQFKEALEGIDSDELKFGQGHLTATNVTDIAIEAKHRFENLMTIAEATQSRLEHDDAIARVMSGFDVMYGQRQIDRLEPKYNKVDKIVDKIESSKIGAIISPETLALATGAAASLVEFMAKREMGAALAIVPGVSAAITSGMKASAEFERERARAMFDVRYSRKFDETQKRRKEIMSTVFEHRSAKSVYEGLDAKVQELEAARSEGKDITAQKDALLRAVAECKYLLSTEKSERSLLSYTNEIDAPIEQLRILEKMARAKATLVDAGESNLDARLDNQTDLMKGVMSQFEQNIKESDKTAKRVKAERILKKSGFSLVSGAVLGIAAQEVRALMDDSVQGMFEKGGDYTQNLTAGRKLANFLTGKSLKGDASANFDIKTGLLNTTDDGLTFVRAQDGSYSLTQNGKEIVSGLTWDPQTGKITADALNKLHERGLLVTRDGTLTQKLSETIQETKTSQLSVEDWLSKGGNGGLHIKRSYWYDNDTQAFDQNELAAHYFTDPESGIKGLVTRMTDTGSSHLGQTAKFSELAQNGEIKLFISATQDTQWTPIEVTGKLLPDGQLAFLPEPGSAAAKFFDADGKFIGRFAEVARDLGFDENGNKLIAPLATAVGDGYTGTLPMEETVSKVVEKSFEIPKYLISAPEQSWNMPIVLPFSPDGAMNASRYERDDSRRTTREPDMTELARDYAGNIVGEGARTGETSPRIRERKQLQLGQEVDWFRDQMRQKRSEDYVNDRESDVRKSPELSAMDGKIKTVVTIPVHAPSEAPNIYKTLSLYAQQRDVDMDSFMVVLNLNWREKEPGPKEEVNAKIRATIREIERARVDFPQLKIATIYQQGHHGIHEVARQMNDTVMVAIDDAVKNGRMAADNDILIIRNDSDVRHLNARYIASYQEAMEKNPKTPLFTGTTYFDIEHTKKTPGFGAVLMIERMNNLFGAVNNGNIHTAGGNFAYRASHFAAANGFGYESDQSHGWIGAGSDDMRVGYKVSDVFTNAYNERYENSGRPEDHDLMDPDTRMLVRVGGAIVDTDDARYLKYYATPGDSVTNDAYRGNAYSANVLRPENLDDFSEKLDDAMVFNGVAEQFEREMSDYITLDDGDTERLGRIICWWFNANSLSEICTVEPTDTYKEGRQCYRFKLTAQGRIEYKEALRKRIGTGTSTNARNSLQRAIQNNDFVTPIMHS